MVVAKWMVLPQVIAHMSIWPFSKSTVYFSRPKQSRLTYFLRLFSLGCKCQGHHGLHPSENSSDWSICRFDKQDKGQYEMFTYSHIKTTSPICMFCFFSLYIMIVIWIALPRYNGRWLLVSQPSSAFLHFQLNKTNCCSSDSVVLVFFFLTVLLYESNYVLAEFFLCPIFLHYTLIITLSFKMYSWEV